LVHLKGAAMAGPTKLNFKMYQGGTFREVLRWEDSEKVYKAITAISKAAPMVVTSASHGIPVGWRAKITNVVGMKEVNSSETYYTVTAVTSGSVTFNAVNSLAYTDYTSGGVLEYNKPMDLIGVTGRMQIRDKLTSETVILELTTENGGIIIDTDNYTITIVVTATQTTLLTFSSAVYSLELINGATVTPFIQGTISLEKEITR
jgi:hypothetical protein